MYDTSDDHRRASKKKVLNIAWQDDETVDGFYRTSFPFSAFKFLESFQWRLT